MRTYELSALLISAGLLLSGCYLGRPSVDRSHLERAGTEAQVCEVSRSPLAVDAVVAELSLAVALISIPLNIGLQHVSGSNSEAGLVSRPFWGFTWSTGIIGGVFAADAVAGAFVVRDCEAAREEWGIMKKMEAKRKQELTAPQFPETAPQPPSTVPQHPVNQRRHPTPGLKLLTRRGP